MSSYFENLASVIISNSISNNWDFAVLEWEIINCIEDSTSSGNCVCGNKGLKYQFTIRNMSNGKELFPIGSSCIKRFGREDLSDFASIQEELFKLLHAVRNNTYLELKSKYFSRNLLEYLFDENVFLPSRYNNYDGYNDYTFLLRKFNARNQPSPREQAKINAIIVSSIKPYLEQVLADKIRP